MANTASISSSFCIEVSQNSAGVATINVANPGRAFTIKQVTIQWIGLASSPGASTVTISKVASGGGVTGLFSGGAIQGSRNSLPVWVADDSTLNCDFVWPDQNASFTSTDSLRIVTADASTQVFLTFYCVGNPSQSLTVT